MLGFIAHIHGLELAAPSFGAAKVLFHSWRPGFIDASEAEVSALEAGSPSTELLERMRDLGWLDEAPPDKVADGLVQRTIDRFPAIQNPVELRAFVGLVARMRPRVVVEIGTAAGGLLYCVSQLTAKDGLIIAIDAPDSPFDACKPNDDDALFARFGPATQTLHMIRDRSGHHGTLVDVERLLDGRLVDLLIIDGDHSYAGARSDYELYRRFVGPEGVIAFHDICMRPQTWGRGHDVGLLWDEVAAGVESRESREIIDPEGSRTKPDFSTPVNFDMPALGFGLLGPAASICA
ncbi:class I SAM-dependent methyltransferase [Enhygromyxa salina]|nr:class I SAM-dependent methyltransferase [Enhygromyxa salina]